ncbi:MAG: ABC transporter permease [Actinomycetota bacterium]|nr:ABC transporter permease [Actinomycetota bacterium]
MQRVAATLAAWRLRYHRNPPLWLASALLALLALMAIAPQVVSGADPRDCQLARSLDPPSAAHPFGFDVQGCDYLAVTMHGTRTSLSIAAIVVSSAFAIAVVLGSLAGFVGGWVDVVVSRVSDVWSGIPLILGGVVLLSTTSTRGVFQVAAVLALFGWPPMVRVMRASVMSTKELEYVQAARTVGMDGWRLLRRHILPNSLRPVLTVASAYAGAVIAIEATLTFAGVGLQLPAISWGIQLLEAQNRLQQAPHLLVFPAAFLVVTVLAFILLGEALRRSSSLAEQARRGGA